ncbi:MAG: MFS transporter [Salaquimonas sp.]
MPTPHPTKARAAVSAVFFSNGLIVGCWAILVPFVIHNLSIAESEMGLIILIGGLSAIIALGMSALLISKFGARAVIVAASLGLAPGLFGMMQSGTFLTAITIFLFIMASLAFQDVAMNANAADLEHRAKRSIMSSFHGFWSAGAMVGSLSGGFLVATFGVNTFAITAGFISLVAALIGYPYLEQKTPAISDAGPMPKYLPAQWLPWMFGLIAFVGFVSEGSIIDWSAQFFREELASGVKLSGIAFGGFSFSMMIARFLGDGLREKIGDQKLFIASVLLAGTGLSSVVIAPDPYWAALGFFMAGFGNANIVPISFSGAATIKGLPKGMGIATASFCGYAGLLVAPATLGFIGEHWGFKLVYGAMALMLIALIALAPMIGRHSAKRLSEKLD